MESLVPSTHIDPQIGKYKAQEFLHLLCSWAGNLKSKCILKTDLREEAYGSDQILFLLPKDMLVMGLDKNERTVKQAWLNSLKKDFRHNYIAGDIREIPFCDRLFDLILSISTLDHFATNEDLIKALLELKRPAKTKATFIIAMNNRKNLSFYFSILFGKWLNWVNEPIRFYTLEQLKTIFSQVGLSIEETAFAVPMISPANRLLLLLRKFINPLIVDKISSIFISFLQVLSRIKTVRSFISWFIVLKCHQVN